MFEQLGLIGCGLMGGSFALALKRAGLVKHVVGYNQSSNESLRAKAMGVIDEQALSAQRAVSDADIVLIAVPVSATEMTLSAIKHLVTPEMLIMDVGSTKSDVVSASERSLGPHVGVFVPAHPITGKEVTGVEHADASLYQGCQVVLTPTQKTWAPQLQQATEVWKKLGCVTVRQMSPEHHDAMFAAVSHLPHLIAFAFMNSIAGQTHAQDLLGLAGPGFRDFTRIAASNPKVWRDIFRTNREALLAQSKMFQAQLELLDRTIADGASDALEQLIEGASSTRAQWTMAHKVNSDNVQN